MCGIILPVLPATASCSAMLPSRQSMPTDYSIEELPKSEKVLLNTDQGYYEYILSADEQSIHFRSRIRLMKANYKPEDYTTLRNFFAEIVKKQSEPIVFKKKK